MMRYMIAGLLITAASLVHGQELDDGIYHIRFRISDMGFSQVVTITNCTRSSNFTHFKFDVVVSENGSLKRRVDDWQSVKNIVYDGHFKFAIPVANVSTHMVFYFEGVNHSTNGVFMGEGDVPFMGPNVGKNKFTFSMTKGTFIRSASPIAEAADHQGKFSEKGIPDSAKFYLKK